MIPLAVAVTLIAGCPDDKDLMWCLSLKSDSRMINLADGRIQFIPNEAMIAYVTEWQKRLKEH